MHCVIGIDAGGTNTRALLVDETGQALAIGRGGPGNPLSAGPEVAMRSLENAVKSALAQGGAQAPALVCVTMAGASDARALDMLKRLDFGPHTQVLAKSDLLSAYLSGRADSPGYILICGTGAVGGQVEHGEVVRVVDGLGWLLGDEGSGFWIGREAVKAVARELDGRGPATALTPLICAELDPGEVTIPRSGLLTALLNFAYKDIRPVQLSRFVGCVLSCLDDPVARSILEGAADSLVKTWRALASGLVLGPTILSGGVLNASPLVRDRLVAEIGPDHAVLVGDGLVGAGLLALREFGAPAGEPQRHRLINSIEGLKARMA